MKRVVVVISAPRRCRTPAWFGAETRRALAAGLAVAAAALAAGWPYWCGRPVAAAVTCAGCASIMVVGVLLGTGGRTRRTGRLFAAASVLWALNWLASWDAGPAPLLAPYAQGGFYLALGVGVLCYPTGRLEYRADRVWAVSACVILTGCPTALWTTSKPEWAAFRGRTVWWPAPFTDLAAFRIVLDVAAALYVLLALAFAAVLVLRLPRMGRLDRVLTLPVTAALLFVGISAALTQKPVMQASVPLSDLLDVYAMQGGVIVLVPLTLLASGLRARIGELTVAGRMLRLTAPVTVERVRAALRDVLHDPTLELWFWAPAEGVYVDAEGRPANDVSGTPTPPVPKPRNAPWDDVTREREGVSGDAAGSVGQGGAARGTGREKAGGQAGRWRRAVLTSAGDALAIVELGAALRDHEPLVEAALAAGGRALETARLQAAVHANLEQVRAAYERLVRAEAVERERLARDLHDGAQQRLLALGAMLGTLEAVTGDPAVREHARACRRELMAALAELRALAREVQPALLVQDGLGPALEVAAERLGTRVRLDVPAERYPREIESALYAALCEALSYAVERAGATRVAVRVRPDGARLLAEVSGDGGARPDGGAETRATTEAGTGAGTDPAADLAGLAGRIRALRGHMEVDGDPLGGTTVRMVLPCE